MRRANVIAAAGFAAAGLLFSSVAFAGARKAAPDDGLYTTFQVQNDLVRYSVCGTLPGSHGCYDGGDLTPFEQACAVLQGSPKTKRNVVTRGLYVLDKRTSKTAPVLLYVYTRTDTLTDTFDTVKVTLIDTINLGITGGSSSHCSMAADKDYIFAGTDADGDAIRISKKDFTLFAFTGVSEGGSVENITTDGRGYFSLKFGGGTDIVYGGFTISDGADGV